MSYCEVSKIQNSFSGLVEDLVELVVCQLEPGEALDFFDRIPEGVVGAVGHAFCAVAVDVFFRFALFHEHQGGGGVENAVLVPQELPGGMEHPVAAEVGGDDGQPGKQIQNPPQPGGVGVGVPGVAHVEHDGDLVLEQVVDREEPLVVDVEPLGVRVHLDAPEAVLQNPVGLLQQAVHLGVEGAEAREILVLTGLGQQKFVDAADSLGGIGHGQYHKMADARLSTPLPEHFYGAIHAAAVDLVEIPDGIRGLPGDGVRVNVGVDVDDLHVIASVRY